MNNRAKNIKCLTISKLIGVFTLLVMMSNCKEDIPEVGSIQDLTPPTASFTFNQFSPSNYLEVTFSNTSVSATDYLWDFGDGNSSIAKEPVYSYAAEGTYEIKLTASDKLGATSTVTQTLVLTEPTAFVPPIKESGFEDLDLTDSLGNKTGDGRDSWRNSGLGDVIQITGSPVLSGSQAAKLTGSSTDQRIGYQLLTVTENTVYDVSFNYTMKDDQAGFLTVSILDGPVNTHQEALNATIGTTTVNDQTDPDTYISETITFNTGTNTEIAIYFFNEGSVETRLDDFSIQLSNGTVPPTAAFDVTYDITDYKNVTFNNNSLNASSYLWNFGDGNTSTDNSPTHSYSTEGNYTVTLTASNSTGESHTFSQDIAAVAPIKVDFDYSIDATDNKKVVFTNNSVNASNYSWDFGDGNSSTDASPAHTYATEGTYSVTLSATNNIGETTSYTENVAILGSNVVTILESGFEDGQLSGNNGDGRDSWRNANLGGVIQITSSPVQAGSQAAKLTSDPLDQRVGFQMVSVDVNTNYDMSFYYTMKSGGSTPSLTVSVLSDSVSTHSQALATTIATTTVNDQSDPDTYIKETISFNSGSSTEVAIYFFNGGTVETRLDDFSIVKH